MLPGFKAGRCRRQAVESKGVCFRTFGPIGVTERLAAVPRLHGRHNTRPRRFQSCAANGTKASKPRPAPPTFQQEVGTEAHSLALRVIDGSIGQPLPAKDARFRRSRGGAVLGKIRMRKSPLSASLRITGLQFSSVFFFFKH